MPNVKYQLSYLLKHKCAVWELTLKCNSKCIHCGSLAGKPRSDELNTEEALTLVNDLHTCGYDGIALMGGEPFLRDDWYEIAKETKKNKMKLTIVSNGLEIIDQIEKLKKLEIDCISISLDGGKPQTHDYLRGIKGAFVKVLRSIKVLPHSLAIPMFLSLSGRRKRNILSSYSFYGYLTLNWLLKGSSRECRTADMISLRRIS